MEPTTVHVTAENWLLSTARSPTLNVWDPMYYLNMFFSWNPPSEKNHFQRLVACFPRSREIWTSPSCFLGSPQPIFDIGIEVFHHDVHYTLAQRRWEALSPLHVNTGSLLRMDHVRTHVNTVVCRYMYVCIHIYIYIIYIYIYIYIYYI